MYFQRITCFFLIYLLNYINGQHILDETCVFEVKLTNSTEKITFASQIYHISNRQKDVYINFCKPLGSSISNCNPLSKVCVKNRNTQRNLLKSAVTIFTGMKEFNEKTRVDDIVLITNDLGNCNQDGDKYSFRVVIDMKLTILENMMSSDECSFDVTLPHPKLQLRDCGVSYNGLIIDMQPIRQYPELISTIHQTKYIIAGCKEAPSCGGTAGICEFTTDKNQTNKFDVAEAQHIVYNERSNSVMIRGRKTIDKTKSEVLVRCNWTETFGNLQKQLAKYKYTVDSKFGCVKVPLNCRITDMYNYEYDLSSLNKPTGWTVRNTSSPMSINICGSLINPPAARKCAEIYSQVCVQQNREYLSYGALHNGLHFVTDDIILTYTHGSTCKVRPDEYYSTRVTLKCTNREMGPVLTNIVDCTVYIQWETPKACAIAIEEGSSLGYPRVMYDLHRTADLDCALFDNGQLFRLGSLSSAGMTFQSRLMSNVKYFINICKPIGITRSNYYCGVTGACIEDGNEASVKNRFKHFGALSNPIMENNSLVVRYNAGNCQNATQREIVITFPCAERQEQLQLTQETTCRADFTWKTPLACKRKVQRSVNCVLSALDIPTLNLSNIAKRNLLLKADTVSYHFDLCSDHVGTNTSDDGFNMTRRLIKTECNYSLIYESPDKKCNSSTLSTITIDLLCNLNDNDDHFENHTRNECSFNIALKSTYMCKHVTECMQHKQHKEQEEQEVQIDIATLPPSKLITQSDAIHDTHAESLAEKTCRVVSDNQQELVINALRGTFMKGAINYTIGGAAGERKCSGFICKNNVTIGTLEVCPFRDDRGTEAVVKFSGPECLTGFYQVNLVLRCATSETGTYKVSKEQNCLTVLEMEDKQSCALLTPMYEANNTGIIISIVLCVIVIIILVVLAWRWKRRNSGYSCVEDITLFRRSSNGSYVNNMYDRNLRD